MARRSEATVTGRWWICPRDEHGAWQSLSREHLCLAETAKLDFVWRYWHQKLPKVSRSEMYFRKGLKIRDGIHDRLDPLELHHCSACAFATPEYASR